MTTNNDTNTTDFTANAEYWIAYDAAFAVFKSAGFTDKGDDVAVDALAAAGAAVMAYSTWEEAADTVEAAWTAATKDAAARINPKTAAKEYRAAIKAEKIASAALVLATDRFYSAHARDKQDAYTTYKEAAGVANRARIKVVAAKVAVDTQKAAPTALTMESAEGLTFITSLIGLEILGWNFDEHYIARYKTLYGPHAFPCGQGMADMASRFENSDVSIRCQDGEFLYSIDLGDYQPSGDDANTLSDINLLSRLGDLREMEKIVIQPRSTKVATF
jgi:hypothetical protein